MDRDGIQHRRLLFEPRERKGALAKAAYLNYAASAASAKGHDDLTENPASKDWSDWRFAAIGRGDPVRYCLGGDEAKNLLPRLRDAYKSNVLPQ